jgi:hypothetical protein
MVSTPVEAPIRAARRDPAWSGIVTRPLARAIPRSRQREALIAIKGLHTALFFSIAAALLVTLWDGLRGRPARRTAVAGGIVAAESLVYVSNNQVCPFTPLAEEFGAERGSVVDMFLPAAVARQVPLVAGSAAFLALVSNIASLSQRTGGRQSATPK